MAWGHAKLLRFRPLPRLVSAGPRTRYFAIDAGGLCLHPRRTVGVPRLASFVEWLCLLRLFEVKIINVPHLVLQIAGVIRDIGDGVVQSCDLESYGSSIGKCSTGIILWICAKQSELRYWDGNHMLLLFGRFGGDD